MTDPGSVGDACAKGAALWWPSQVPAPPGVSGAPGISLAQAGGPSPLLISWYGPPTMQSCSIGGIAEEMVT